MENNLTESQQYSEQELKGKLAELQEENKLLHTQTKLLHDEVAKYYKRFAQLEVSGSSPAPRDMRIEEKLKELEFQKARMQAKEDALKKLFPHKDNDPGVFSFGRSQPGTLKLLVSRGLSNEPTSRLGGNAYAKVISAYKSGGLASVFALLASEPVTGKVWAGALTALARELGKTDRKKCAELALLAWRLDPRPYRLKWLAFRAHEGGESILADALVDIFPPDLELKENEKERVKRIRTDSRHALLLKAQQNGAASDLKEQLERYRSRLEQIIAENAGLKAGQGSRELAAQTEIASLQNAVAELQEQLERTSAQLDEHKKLLAQKELEIGCTKTRCELLEKALANEEKNRTQALGQILAAIRENDERQERNFTSYLEKRQQTDKDLSGKLDELSQSAEKLKQADEALTGKMGSLTEYMEMQMNGENGLAASLQSLSRDSGNILEGMSQGWQKLDVSLAALGKTVEGNETRHAQDMKQLGESQSKEIRNAISQLSAFDGLKQYFSGADLPQVDLWDYGWPANPDFMLQLVRLIEKNEYDLIVEFGSGFSTLFTARAIARKSATTPGKNVPEFVSFDHLDEYYNKTASLLRKAGLDQLVHLNLLGLAPYHSPDGNEYFYYSCNEILEELGERYRKPECRILAIVDGPPGTTCKNARYPAFPLLMRYLSPARIDFIMDDFRRMDERETVAGWQMICESGGIPFIREDLSLEKGACLFQVNRRQQPEY